jgi:hypothetical protein
MWACRVHDRAWNPDRSWRQARQDTKTGEPHSAVPDFPVYTTISLTAHLMKEQLAYTHTHMYDSPTYLHTCIQRYMHPSSILYSPLLSSSVSPSSLLYHIPLSSRLLCPPLLTSIIVACWIMLLACSVRLTVLGHMKRIKLTTSTDQLQVSRGSVFIRPGWLIQQLDSDNTNKHERQEPKTDRELKLG